jgi:Tol biopolymer transport system component/tRNA A-37 threonylcarbamoyl transferase component Bud32
MDRWQRIEELFEEAQAWDPASRDERLAAACGDDAGLRREVEELLAQHDQSGQLLDRPVWSEDVLEPGMTLGSYQIESKLGAGGMGEVWKARDRRLNRPVAIKVSRAQFSARVEREARAVAALNHPNIAALYDIASAPAGFTYLVLEYVDGPTLADRLARGRVPLDEALAIARQLADALEAAHERGIIHRDLKPANIKLRPDGTIKVLDFGLAKALDWSDAAASSPDVSGNGTITGTAAYMAPEQARGEAVDKRADIWAFGTVMYEMLTGERPFSGNSIPEVLASVLKEQPDFTKVPPQTRRLVVSCLEKDPRKRLRDIGDALRLLLDDERPAAAPAPAPAGASQRPWLIGAAAAIVVLVGAPLAVYVRTRPVAPSADSISFQVIPPGISRYIALALSPDGKKLAFSAAGFDGITRLWVRDFDSIDARAIPEADGLQGAPLWSPDGKKIAFASKGKLKTLDANGGTPLTLCDWPGDGGELTGTWGANDVIVFARATGGLQRVAAAGGLCADLTKTGRRPSILPDGKHFVYFSDGANGEVAGVYAGSLDAAPTAQPTQPILNLVYAGKSATVLGVVQSTDRSRTYLLTTEKGSSAHGNGEGGLVAQILDTDQIKVSGEPIAVPMNIVGGFGNGAAGLMFSFSSTGTMAYTTNGTGRYQNVWYDRTGKVIGTAGDPGDVGDVAISPDETQTAFHSREGQDDMWIFDFARRVTTRLTVSPNRDHQAVWAPDGRHIVWGMQVMDSQALYAKASNGSGEERLILEGDRGSFNVPDDWSPDGRFILYADGVLPSGPAFNFGIGRRLRLLPVQLDGTPTGSPQTYLQSLAGVGHARFSPNGRWVAYTGGNGEPQTVYVSPFPAQGDERLEVSNGGGYQPLWRHDGKELFYVSRDGKIMAVDVDTTSAAFHSGTPKPLFSVQIAGGPAAAPTHRWDVSRDGQRFLVTTVLDVTQSPPINVVTNWESSLKR